jgi:hypothetical protein
MAPKLVIPIFGDVRVDKKRRSLKLTNVSIYVYVTHAVEI